MVAQKEHLEVLAVALREERKMDPWPKAIAALLAFGLSPKDIAGIFDESEERVLRIRNSERCQELVSKLQAGVGMSSEQRLAAALPTALDVLSSSLTSGSVKVSEKIKVAQDIIDRNLGRAVQTTQTLVATVTSATPDSVINGQLEAVKARLALIEKKKAALVGSKGRLTETLVSTD
jgi:hypothetical protein